MRAKPTARWSHKRITWRSSKTLWPLTCLIFFCKLQSGQKEMNLSIFWHLYSWFLEVILKIFSNGTVCSVKYNIASCLLTAPLSQFPMLVMYVVSLVYFLPYQFLYIHTFNMHICIYVMFCVYVYLYSNWFHKNRIIFILTCGLLLSFFFILLSFNNIW